VADWKLAVAHILEGDYRARLECGGVAIPSEMETAFAEHPRYSTVGGVGLEHELQLVVDRRGDGATIAELGDHRAVLRAVLVCHFLSLDEIELSFEPHQLSETGSGALLFLMYRAGRRRESRFS